MTQIAPTLHALLANTVDYAGLYPPASLDLPTTVGNFLTYASGAHHALLGKLIIPANKLGDFAHCTQNYPFPHAEHRELSVLVNDDDLEAALTWRHKTYKITALEAKASTPADIDRLAARLPAARNCFVEIPLGPQMPDLLRSLAKSGLHPKVRTGGETPDKFPSPTDLAAFIEGCANTKIMFKATAGLHHPIRAIYRLTYAPDSPKGTMHGFLNVFMAAIFALRGWNTGQLAGLLIEEDAASFHFDADFVSWRGYEASLEDVRAARQTLLASFGSCSFMEPIRDLHALHLIK
ncbi:MAG: hypothetical protein JO126_00530 [Alphaproteobacteria bacterium]|nr:hypothetical protein [Alphaproteobacteria bacterium]MBV8547925.1 hypothetical protein [Alphaproteobacteria bacterium]